jgi:hypothetical protein
VIAISSNEVIRPHLHTWEHQVAILVTLHIFFIAIAIAIVIVIAIPIVIVLFVFMHIISHSLIELPIVTMSHVSTITHQWSLLPTLESVTVWKSIGQTPKPTSKTICVDFPMRF